jgi:O-antigen ligase
VLSFRLLPRERVLVVGTAALSGAALLFTFQRGAWLAALAGIAALVPMLTWTGRRRLAALLPVVLIGGVLSAGAFDRAAAGGPESLLASAQSRLLSVADVPTDVSAQHRLAELSATAAVVQDKPWTGIGLGGAVTFVSPLYNPAYNAFNLEFSAVYLHNSAMWLAAKMGIPALLVMVALLLRAGRLALTGRTGVRCWDGLAVVVVPQFVTVLVLSLSGPHLTTDNETAVVAMLIAGMSAVAGRRRFEEGRHA